MTEKELLPFMFILDAATSLCFKDKVPVMKYSLTLMDLQSLRIYANEQAVSDESLDTILIDCCLWYGCLQNNSHNPIRRTDC